VKKAIVYVGDSDVTILATRQVAHPGVPLLVEAPIADRLLTQSVWTEATPKRPTTPPAPKRSKKKEK